MKQSKTTLKELSACYRAVLRHGILCNAIALGLVATPSMADELYYTWWHPENINSYEIINDDINSVVTGGEYNFITGTSMRNFVNGDVNLTLDGVRQVAKINPRDSHWVETNVFGSIFLPSSGGYLYNTELGVVIPDDESRDLQQWINGDINVLVKNNSVIENSVIGVNFYAANNEITESGLSGKTTVTVEDSTVNQSVRGTNYRDIDQNSSKTLVGDIELNVINSLIKEEIVSAGSAASAGNVVINIVGNSVVGYTDKTATTKTHEDKDNWIIAGANRNGATIASTTINLNTDGADNAIWIAGDVHSGSRDRRIITTDAITIPNNNPDENSVSGNATLNMLGGGDINIGGNLRAYHVAGDKTLNINNVTANIGGNVQEFQTINMDENATLNVDGTLTLAADDNVNIVLQDLNTYSKINATQLDANGANLNFLVSKQGTYNIVHANQTISDFTWNPENALFDFSHNNGVLTATAKSADEIAETTNINSNAANTVSALAHSDNADANRLSLIAQDVLTRGDTKYVENELENLTPSKSPVATSVALGVQSHVLSAAGERMSLALTGRNGGDVHADFGVWAKGMYNKTKHSDLLNANTWGTSVGFDTDLNHSVILGVGYSYGQTDADLKNSNIDIDSNTVFVYGQYRNADWFINGTIAYIMSKYDWNKSVFGTDFNTAYHVNSLSEQVMGGYHFANGITPTLGLRYLNVNQDSYFDGLTTVGKVNSTYLTGVAGVDYKYTWIAPYTSLFWNPELHAAVTYDMVSDSNMAIVMIPGAAAYTVATDELSRLGGEFGIGLSAEYYYLTVSLNYDLNVHRDFTSQTGSLKIKYKF